MSKVKLFTTKRNRFGRTLFNDLFPQGFEVSEKGEITVESIEQAKEMLKEGWELSDSASIKEDKIEKVELTEEDFENLETTDNVEEGEGEEEGETEEGETVIPIDEIKSMKFGELKEFAKSVGLDKVEGYEEASVKAGTLKEWIIEQVSNV
jgi:hypothetical protein